MTWVAYGEEQVSGPCLGLATLISFGNPHVPGTQQHRIGMASVDAEICRQEGDAPIVSGHRYWSLSGFSVGTEMELSELKLYENGIAQPVVPTVVGGAFAPYVGAPANWVDGLLNNRCGFFKAQAENPAFRVVYDYGGSVKNINGAAQGGYDSSPLITSTMTLSWSDDAVAWTVVGTKTGLTYPGNFTLGPIVAFP